VIGGRSALRPDGRDEHKLPDSGVRRRGRKLGGRLAVDAVVKFVGDARSMCDTGEMDDPIDAVEQRGPVERLRQIRMLHDLDAWGERRLRRMPHGRAHPTAGLRESADHGAADESRGAGHQKPHHAELGHGDT